MTTFSIAEAGFSGVRLLGRHPVAAMIWALLYVAFLAVIIVPFAGGLFSFISVLAASRGAQPTPEQILPLIGGILGFYILFLVGSLVVGAVIGCAVYRAVLEPESSSYAFLRLGPQELWVMLVNFVQGVVGFLVQIAVMIPFTILAATFALSDPATSKAISIVEQPVLLGVIAWVSLRLCLAAPMAFSDHRFRLFESWGMTRGFDWRLVGVGALVFALMLGVYLVVAIIGIAGGAAVWNSTAHPANLQAFLNRPPGEWVSALSPFLILVGALIAIGGTVMIPLFVAPWAFLYSRLHPSADVAATFS